MKEKVFVVYIYETEGYIALVVEYENITEALEQIYMMIAFFLVADVKHIECMDIDFLVVERVVVEVFVLVFVLISFVDSVLY